VACSPVARQWLVGGKVLLASTGGVSGRRRARRVETGLTEAVSDDGAAEGGRRGGLQWRWGCSSGRRCVGRGPPAPVWKGEERFSSNLGNDEARRALTGEGEDNGGARQNPT
jgi:hypothetical protein